MELKPITAGLPQPSRAEAGQVQQQVSAQSMPIGDTITISVATMLKGLLDQTSLQIAEQHSMLQSLPLPMQAAAKQILQTTLPDGATLSTGLTMLLASRRNATDGLNRLADSLQLSALFPEFDNKLRVIVSRFNQDLSATLTQQAIDMQDQAILEQSQLDKVRNLVNQLPEEIQTIMKRLATFKQASAFTVPRNVMLAAKELDMPQLPQLFFLADTDLTPWQDKPSALLEQSAATVRTLADSVSKAFHTVSEDRGQNLLFTMQLPYITDTIQPQPIHIHLYHERPKENADGSESPSDTWVRLTIQPDHTGPVETIFHLYGESILDIKVIFADKQASQLFSEELPAIRAACGDFPFQLREVSVL